MRNFTEFSMECRHHVKNRRTNRCFCLKRRRQRDKMCNMHNCPLWHD
jgi:hypothetical protein